MPYRDAFMSHAHADNVTCLDYANRLRAKGIDLWLDLNDAQQGHFLTSEIQTQIDRRSTFILMMTATSLASFWVGLERGAFMGRMARDRSLLMLPVRLEPVAVPSLLDAFLWIDAVNRPREAVIDDIARALTTAGDRQPPPPNEWESIGILSRLARLGFAGHRVRKTGVEFILPPTCAVPAGSFTMGSDKALDPQAYDDECPQYDIYVDACQIGTFPLTVAEYGYAVKAGAVPAPPDDGITWAKQQERPDHPVVNVSWLNVTAYAAWLARTTGQPWRLPTEAEWEKAARWDAKATPPHARIYPRGDQWDKAKANTMESGEDATTPVGKYMDKGDSSPCGAHDMAGNVWEWTSSIWQDHPPYDARKCDNASDTSSERVLRGGSWIFDSRSARAACRSWGRPGYLDYGRGARLLRGAGAGSS